MRVCVVTGSMVVSRLVADGGAHVHNIDLAGDASRRLAGEHMERRKPLVGRRMVGVLSSGQLGPRLRGRPARHLSVGPVIADAVALRREVGVKALVLRHAASEVGERVVRRRRVVLGVCHPNSEPLGEVAVLAAVRALVHAALHAAKLGVVVVAAVILHVGAGHAAHLLATLVCLEALSVHVAPVVAGAHAMPVVLDKGVVLDTHLAGTAHVHALHALIELHAALNVSNDHVVGIVAHASHRNAVHHARTLHLALVDAALEVSAGPPVGVAAAAALAAPSRLAFVHSALVVDRVVPRPIGRDGRLAAGVHAALGVAADVVARILRALDLVVHVHATRDVELVVVDARADGLGAVHLEGVVVGRDAPPCIRIVAEVHDVVALVILAEIGRVARLHRKVGVMALLVAADARILDALVNAAARNRHLVGALRKASKGHLKLVSVHHARVLAQVPGGARRRRLTAVSGKAHEGHGHLVVIAPGVLRAPGGLPSVQCAPRVHHGVHRLFAADGEARLRAGVAHGAMAKVNFREIAEVVLVAHAVAVGRALALSVAEHRHVGVHADLVGLAGVVSGTALVAREPLTAQVVHARPMRAHLVGSALVRIKALVLSVCSSLPDGLEAGEATAVGGADEADEHDAGVRHGSQIGGVHSTVEGRHVHCVGVVGGSAPLDMTARVDVNPVGVVEPELGEGELDGLGRRHRHAWLWHHSRGNDPVAGGACVVDILEPLEPALGP
mmetsp:Transcript_29405/g.57556  ORF Transcript_29405/g.57556 Transcript_29405/m.57556 type:complete len:731 (-) Transcript_29405:251-2443(-)